MAALAGQFVGVAQYDRIPGSDVAEVAFVVDDAHQGLGLGTFSWSTWPARVVVTGSSVRGGHLIREFADGERLPGRRFYSALPVRRWRDPGGDGHFPHREALPALYERDRKAVVRSMARLLQPRSIAVVGASRTPGTIGHELVRNLVAGGFRALSTRSTPGI